ncbi:hypothetical protein HK405_007442, partial [Cladochytrium tenue]
MPHSPTTTTLTGTTSSSSADAATIGTIAIHPAAPACDDAPPPPSTEPPVVVNPPPSVDLMTPAPTTPMPTGQWLYFSNSRKRHRPHTNNHHGHATRARPVSTIEKKTVTSSASVRSATAASIPTSPFVNHNQRRSSPPYVDPPSFLEPRELEFSVPSGIVIRARAWGRPLEQGDLPDAVDLAEALATSRVLALHGWMDNAGSWDLVAPRLAHLGAYVVCMDLSGHGLSDHRHVQGGYYLWDMIDDILGVADLLGWPRFNLLGHSTGGHLASVFAGCYRNRVRALCMVESIGTCIQFTADEATELAAFVAKRREVRKNGGQTRVFGSVEEAVRARMRGFTSVSADAARILCKRGLTAVSVASDSTGQSVVSSPSCSIMSDVSSAHIASVPGSPSHSPASNSQCKGTPTKSPGLGYQWTTDASVTLWAFLHCPEDTIITFFKFVSCPVLVIAADRSELFSLDGKKWSKRLAGFKALRKETLFGSHHLHLERESAESVIKTVVDFFGWGCTPPTNFWIQFEDKPAGTEESNGKDIEQPLVSGIPESKISGGCLDGVVGIRMKAGEGQR